MKLYHALGKKWELNQPIYSMDRAIELGLLSEDDYAWGDSQDFESYADSDLICFHNNLDDAMDWAKENELTYIAVVDSENLPCSTFTNGEGFPCVALGTIDAFDLIAA